ncbi:hypothetical protein PC113_g2394 [Phytophthora cactorum]|uniref:Peptidase S74 domain-containing protein n=1 Tax=Phytophthora cactorum TaxID=29920 RepID=A0A8T0ZUB0_9STRA|nr:hypothetical protein PC113_g2394 [Phytophthora cactorum]
MLTTSTSSILLGGTLSANTVSCTNLTQNGVSYNLASFLTSIPSSLSLSSLTVSGTGAQFNTSAGNTDSIYLPVGSYAMYLRNNSNIISTSVGLAFLNDSSGAYSTTTPSATISTLRRSSTQYDGSDIEFYTKGSASQTGALYRLASLHGTTGQLSIGSNNGYMDLNILKDNAGASIRIGSYQSTANCFTITYSYVGSSYAQNRLQFDNYGFSGQQCWFGDNSVAINSQDVPPAKFAIKGDTTKMYGSWDRVQRWSNDQSTQMAVEMLVYNESGGSNNSSGGGTCLGTMTNDPFKIMTNGSARALFNTSGRFMVGGNFSAEATIHSGGASWANEEFYTKINASSICSYRANWSSANYWGWGSDGTVGSIRAGICNASGSWLGYVPIRGGAYTNASDERLKTDIANVPYGLDAVMLMKPRKYKMIQEGTQHVGFIAQELYDIVPEAVQEGANDDMNENGYPINPWGIDLASLTSVLCKAIQDQQAQIEELKRIVSTLI